MTGRVVRAQWSRKRCTRACSESHTAAVGCVLRPPKQVVHGEYARGPDQFAYRGPGGKTVLRNSVSLPLGDLTVGYACSSMESTKCPRCGACTCAMTEASQLSCDLHGLDSDHAN